MTDTSWLERLEQEHLDVELTRFSRREAWELGSAIVEGAIAASFPVAVDIRTSTGVLFHASLPGATVDNDHWVRRKAAAALRLETSTALLEARASAGGRDYFSDGWLNHAEYAIAGGSVPIRVRGIGVVAVATVSGLHSADDHDLVVQAISSLAAAQEDEQSSSA